MRLSAPFIALLVLGTQSGAQAIGRSTYAVVVAGTTCTQTAMPYESSAQLNCVYVVGKGLRFSIAGVGQEDAAILVEHADGIDSDFYFKFGVMHGCVIVTRGFTKRRQPGDGPPGFDMAFVSPRTGRAYKTWEQCRAPAS